jgi:Uma2 family endonuclease
MGDGPGAKISAAEYLERDSAAPFRSEYYGGESFAISGGKPAHARLILEFGRALADALEDGPYEVTASELRLQVKADETYVYPDLMVVCGGYALTAGRQDTITNPVAVLEVLSESTEAWDRGGKFALYQGVATLREYVLASTGAMRVEWFTREGEGEWRYRVAEGAGAVVRLEGLGVTLDLAGIYRKVVLG